MFRQSKFARILTSVVAGLTLSMLPFEVTLAQPRPAASPKASPSPAPSPVSSPAPLSDRQELERLRQQEQIQQIIEQRLWNTGTIRDIIKYEVSTSYGTTLSLVQILLVLLILATVAVPLGFWLLRNLIIHQLVEQAKDSFNQEIATSQDEANLELKNLLSNAQIVLKELSKERNQAQQEIASLKHEIQQLRAELPGRND